LLKLPAISGRGRPQAEIKKDRYVYYHCTFDKGKCDVLYVREEELERRWKRYSGSFSFPRPSSTGCGKPCGRAKSRRRSYTAAPSRS
jgi:hypothetical protein